MTKKQLQKQIDCLEQRLGAHFIMINNVYIKISKLEQYLGIEYKVTESKREEGYVKKEDVLFGNNLSGACSVGDYSGNFIKGKEGRIAKPKKEDIAIGFGESEYITKATRPSSDKKKK